VAASVGEGASLMVDSSSEPGVPPLLLMLSLTVELLLSEPCVFINLSAKELKLQQEVKEKTNKVNITRKAAIRNDFPAILLLFDFFASFIVKPAPSFLFSHAAILF
jgi:hypothetical protein